MYLLGGKSLSIIIAILLLIAGCRCNQGPDVTGLVDTLIVNRFEQDLFGMDVSNMDSNLDDLRDKYGNFFNLFAFGITSLGSRDTQLMVEQFRSFITDTNFIKVYKDCESQFEDFSSQTEKLKRAFGYYSYYFPDRIIPKVITMITGFSYPIVCDSAVLGISLDMYLGAGYYFYSTLGPPLPNYLRRRMDKAFLVSDAMKGWAMSDYPLDETSASMMDFMISQGRILYFLDKVLPEEADSLKTGYSAEQLNWCINNEKKIWSFFIENRMLFSKDPNQMNKYVNDGPTTQGFPKEAPGNIGQFTGWQIVKSYMKNHSEVTLRQLMEETDLIRIFNEADYKPAR